MPTNRSYHDYLIKSLKDPVEAAGYLEIVLEDCTLEELRLAIGHVAEARLASFNDSHDDSQPLSSSEANSGASSEALQAILASKDSLDELALVQAIGKLGFQLSVTPMAVAQLQNVA
jgi:hypothetical protein